MIVTACPFCMVNIEDAIKVAGMEGQMTAIDLAELVDRQMVSQRKERRKMEILVCAKRVPDTSENEIQLNGAGTDIERDDLVYSVNEPDNYAVEEALQIVARTGGNVTVVTVGGEEDEEILRREMAMGANRGVLISDDAFSGSDGRGIAAILKAFVQTGHYDLILTGVQAEDGCAQVGGMLAAMLDYPFASLVTSIEVLEGRKLKIGREIEGGSKEINAIDLPCVLSIQTGINEPRYVGHARHPAGGLRADPDPRRIGSRRRRRRGGRSCREGRSALDYFVPPAGKGAEMLAGQPRGGRRKTDGSAESQRRAELMPRIFAYIVHKSGVADDTAAELPVAARKIDPAQSCTAIVTGWGADLDQVCESLRASYSEIWKIAKEPLAYPNAELVRKALVERAAARAASCWFRMRTSASISRRGFPSR